jgi:hypothetical protein
VDYKTIPEILGDSRGPVLLEKKNSKITYEVRERDYSYAVLDQKGHCYFIGKLKNSIALEPIWREKVAPPGSKA